MTWGIRSAKAEPSMRLRVGLAALLACLGLGWQAQAAHATYGKVTIVKVNQGGDQTDAFTFRPQLMPSAGDFSIEAGEAKRRTFSVECNVDRPGRSGECSRWGYPSLKVTELASPGYDLTGIVCRHTQGTSGYAGEPTTGSTLDTDTTVALGSRSATLKVSWYEWVKCWVTNAARLPAVAIDKAGPATAVAGSLVGYRLDVTNPGNVPFAAARVVVGDALCQAPPALDSKNGDSSPGTLDPGDTWTYGCSVQTQLGQTRVDNLGQVEATDDQDRKVSDDDNAITDLTQPEVIPPTISPQPEQALTAGVATARGSARLSGLAGCSSRNTLTASVTGSRIVKVTFRLDGRRVRTLTRPDARGRWALLVRLSQLPFGGHELRADVQFARDTAPATRTLRTRFSRCRLAAARPQFTG